MKRFVFLLLILPVLLVLLLLLTQMRWKFAAPRTPAVAANRTNSASAPVTSTVPDGPKPQLLGETILRDYASPDLPPQNDLTLISRLMENSLLLLKAAGNRPLSANEDWAALWRGSNAAHERFLPDRHRAFNASGQLIDRWGTPLFFHALGGNRYELRSAGPDRILWTDDDLHRNSDGSFRHGADLNPANLVPAANR